MSEELHNAAHLDELVDQWKAEDDVRREICDIGSRIWQRAFSAGNEGNISYRLSEHFIVCTPTMVSKGFLQPKDLAVIDFDMHQIKGDRRYTSEIRLHMQIYKENPKVRAVVHCHPPHATAFGVAGEEIPLGVLPEPEIFLGAVPRAVYETPGTWDFAKTVLPHVKNANTVILANHGTVSWDTQSVERAFWYTEILEAYCRILLIAKQVGAVGRLSAEKVHELLELRTAIGFPPDRRQTEGVKGEALLTNAGFASEANRGYVHLHPDQLDNLAERIADKIGTRV